MTNELERLTQERDEARKAFQWAMGWWAARSDVRPQTVTAFFDWLEEQFPWMKQDLEALEEANRT